jgi:hypothetical protein
MAALICLLPSSGSGGLPSAGGDARTSREAHQ